MCAETKHDEVSIRSIYAVRCVGVVAFLGTLRTDEVEDLVLTFSWDGGV